MKWDPELARMAQAWANQCLFQHDTCRDVDRFRVGQNLAISMSSVAGSASSSWATAINGTMNGKWVGWFSEVQAMKSGYVNGGWAGPDFSSVGHYTQMMWADSYLVGCAVIQYKSSRWFNTLNVCNYGPTGNFNGLPVYKIGRGWAGPDFSSVGHYTQMMWADSYLVGCAVIQYKSNGWYNTLNVCNYGPSGNFNSGPVYATGTKAASACPATTTANTATGLCV